MHAEALRSSPNTPTPLHPSPPILPPTELIPGARHARSAVLPTHARALSIIFLLSSLFYRHPLHGAVNHAVFDGEGLASVFPLACRV